MGRLVNHYDLGTVVEQIGERARRVAPRGRPSAAAAAGNGNGAPPPDRVDVGRDPERHHAPGRRPRELAQQWGMWYTLMQSDGNVTSCDAL